MEMDFILGEPAGKLRSPTFGTLDEVTGTAHSLRGPHPGPLPETEVLRGVVVKYEQPEDIVMESVDTGWFDLPPPPLPPSPRGAGSGPGPAGWSSRSLEDADEAGGRLHPGSAVGYIRAVYLGPYCSGRGCGLSMGIEDPHPRPLPETEVIETKNQYDGQTVAYIYRDPDAGTIVRKVVVKYNEERVAMEREDTGWLDSGIGAVKESEQAAMEREDIGWLDSGIGAVKESEQAGGSWSQ